MPESLWPPGKEVVFHDGFCTSSIKRPTVNDRKFLPADGEKPGKEEAG